MSYNFDKNTCDECRISKEEIHKRVDCAMTYAEKMHKCSFVLGQDGSVLCPDCFKEKALKEII